MLTKEMKEAMMKSAMEAERMFGEMLKELAEMEKEQKPKSFEQLMEELDKVKADAECVSKMGLSSEIEVVALLELCEKKAKIIEQMHEFVDAL